MKRLGFAFATLALLSFANEPAKAWQNDNRATIPFEGYDVLRYLLKHLKLEPITSWNDLARVPPEDVLYIQIGPSPSFRQQANALANFGAFLQKGGNILVATDRPFPVTISESSLGISIAGGQVEQIAGGYRGEQGLPFFRGDTLPGHILFAGCSAGLATNRPSYIKVNRRPDQVVLKFPGSCYSDGFRAIADDGQGDVLGGLLKAMGQNDRGFLSASSSFSLPSGRTLVMAGSSVFFNGMMLQPDNGNFRFAHNAMKWLSENAGDGRRKVCLVINGEIEPSFESPLQAPDFPMPTADLINKLLTDLQDEGVLDDLQRQIPDLPLRRFVILASAFLLLVYGAKKLIGLRRVPDTGVPITVGETAGMPETFGLMAERATTLSFGINFAGAGQDLARTVLEELAITQIDAWSSPSPPSRPTLSAPGGKVPRGWEKKFARIWEAAIGLRSQSLSEFRSLLSDLDDLKVAFHKKKLMRPNTVKSEPPS